MLAVVHGTRRVRDRAVLMAVPIGGCEAHCSEVQTEPLGRLPNRLAPREWGPRRRVAVFDHVVGAGTGFREQVLEQQPPGLIECADCLCLASRRAARQITRVYDRELRPYGLRVTQFTVLVIL